MNAKTSESCSILFHQSPGFTLKKQNGLDWKFWSMFPLFLIQWNIGRIQKFQTQIVHDPKQTVPEQSDLGLHYFLNPKSFWILTRHSMVKVNKVEKWSCPDMSLNIKFSYLAENSKFSRSNSYFSILTPTFLRDGFLNSCFQNPSENSEN